MSTEDDNGKDYASRQAFFERLLTLYGRKPALEALRDPTLACHALHLADSNRSGGIIAELTRAAAERGVPVRHHSRLALSRISRNGKQDQGVALDVICPGFRSLDTYLTAMATLPPQRILALDGITNPQNLGMILRSAAAGSIDAVLWSRKGNAALGPLVIKASAGTVYRAPLVTCEALPEGLGKLKKAGAELCSLAADARESLFSHRAQGHAVYILGNETEGVSQEATALAATTLSIPMNNGVESLNVAVTASLIAFASQLQR